MSVYIDQFKARLRNLKDRFGGSERSFANQMGLKQTTLRAILGGGSQGPSLSTVYELMESLGENQVWYLLTGKEPPAPRPEPPPLTVQVTKNYRPVADAVESGYYVPIPLLHDTAAAGPPSEVNEYDIDGYALIYADRRWMPNPPENYTCICVKGKSMFPILDDGDIVAIDHAVKHPNAVDGSMVAFRVNGGVTIKWCKFLEDRETVVGVPENKDELDHVVMLVGEEIDDGIVGKVRWWWSKR